VETQENKACIPVEALHLGLYVSDLDRPWVETPFLFQGFELQAEEDLATLREQCRHVYVDVQRSRSDAVAAMRQMLARNSEQAVPARPRAENDAEPSARGQRRKPAKPNAFGDARYPDAERFVPLIEKADESRREARRLVDSAMSDSRLGRMVDVQGAREYIEDLVHMVSEDASAALWLTNLKDRDEYTSIHCVNVCVFALTLGRHMGLDTEALKRLGVGALLHDVGKTMTPDEVLNKPGPLTADEFEIVKRHPEDGYRIIRDSGSISREALEVIRYHHERISGQGYPAGLQGDELPLHVLIAGLVDSYDAMTSDRTYQRGSPPDRVLQGMYNKAPDMFGLDLVQEFIRCVGIFPVGSLVELDNGALGVVVASRPEARLQPTIVLVRGPAGESYDERTLLNLAARASRGERAAANRIRRAVEPGSAGVDVKRIVAEEFGLGGA